MTHSSTLIASEEPSKSTEVSGELLLGLSTGALGAYVYTTTGTETALHEVVGHGMLGVHLTSNYESGTGPKYWISGFDQFKAIGRARSPLDKLKAVFSWVCLPPPAKGGAVGTTSSGNNYNPNKLAHYMGPDGTSAWISISGSLPGLGFDTLCVASGMALRKKHPGLGIALITFGMINSIAESAYAWDAVVTIFKHKSAIPGHDFVNFANRMSIILGLPASAIALSTALFFTGFVPMVILCMYLLDKTRKNKKVEQEQLGYKLSKLEQILRYAAAATIIASAASQLTSVLSMTIVPALTPVAIALKTLIPILGLLSIVQSAHETYQDFL